MWTYQLNSTRFVSITAMTSTKTEGEKCQSGYKCAFKDASIYNNKLLMCDSCETVARDLSLIICCGGGGQYCGPYLQTLKRDGRPCPHCGKELAFIALQKQRTEILGSRVFCDMKQQGCNWEGEVQDLDQHQDICEHVYIPCTKRCGLLQIKRGQMEEHLQSACPEREYSCPHCNYKGTYRLVTSAHYAECSYFPLKCPNECGVEGERDDMQTHLQRECPLQYIPCKFSHAGCNEKFRREDEDAHMKEQPEQHLESLASLVAEHNERIEDLTKMHQARSEQQSENDKKHSAELAELRDQLAQERSTVDSLERQVNNMADEGDDISPPEHQPEDNRSRENLEEKLKAKDREIQQLRRTQEDTKAALEECKAEFEERLAKLEKTINCYRGAAPEQHAVRPRDNGNSMPLPPVFTLEGFAALKESKAHWSSDTFTPCAENGSSLKLVVWPNGQGDGAASYVSVWLEEELEMLYDIKDLDVTLTLKLVDQDDRNNLTISATKTFSTPFSTPFGNRYAELSNKFVSHEALMSEDSVQYLKDDTLKFKITYMMTTPKIL